MVLVIEVHNGTGKQFSTPHTFIHCHSESPGAWNWRPPMLSNKIAYWKVVLVQSGGGQDPRAAVGYWRGYQSRHAQPSESLPHSLQLSVMESWWYYEGANSKKNLDTLGNDENLINVISPHRAPLPPLAPCNPTNAPFGSPNFSSKTCKRTSETVSPARIKSWTDGKSESQASTAILPPLLFKKASTASFPTFMISAPS